MLRILKELFSATATSTTEDSKSPDSISKIVSSLEKLDKDEARYLAAFAFILSRVAVVDEGASAEEIKNMEQIVIEKSSLTREQAQLVVQISKLENHLFGATENFIVTKAFAKMANHDQKLKLLENLFSVAAADNTVSLLEEGEIRQISDELGLSHSDFIGARLKVRDLREVNK